MRGNITLLFTVFMKIKSKRDINREVTIKKYQELYADMQKGMGWDEIAKKYKYTDAKSAASTWQLYIKPMLEGL